MMETVEWMSGRATMFLSILSVLLVMPALIRLNRRAGRCAQPLRMIVLTIVLLACRVTYVSIRREWLLLPSDAIGLLQWLYIFRQYVAYGPWIPEDAGQAMAGTVVDEDTHVPAELELEEVR